MKNKKSKFVEIQGFAGFLDFFFQTNSESCTPCPIPCALLDKLKK